MFLLNRFELIDCFAGNREELKKPAKTINQNLMKKKGHNGEDTEMVNGKVYCPYKKPKQDAVICSIFKPSDNNPGELIP